MESLSKNKSLIRLSLPISQSDEGMISPLIGSTLWVGNHYFVRGIWVGNSHVHYFCKVGDRVCRENNNFRLSSAVIKQLPMLLPLSEVL